MDGLRPAVDDATAKAKGLQTGGQWDLTLISLGAVVLLACLLPFVTGTAGYDKAQPNVDAAVWGTRGGAPPLEFGRGEAAVVPRGYYLAPPPLPYDHSGEASTSDE